MIEVYPFRAVHYAELVKQGEPNGGGLATPEMLKCMEKGECFTAFADGLAIAAGGLLQKWPGSHLMISYLTPKSGPHMLALTRIGKKLVAGVKGRIECTTRADFTASIRWLQMIGFKIETPLLRGYGPDGSDHIGFYMFQE